MQVLEKNIKGFNLLELIVVLVIVGVISAVAYPNFSEWRKEREVRQGLAKIQSLIKNIHIQTERGTFAFVQVLIDPTDTHIAIQSKGMTMQSLASKINDGSDLWNTDSTSRCDMTTTNYWDTDNATDGSDIKNAVYSLSLGDITTNIENLSAICFSRNGKFYHADGDFEDDGVLEFMYICRRDFEGDYCSVDYGKDDEGNVARQAPSAGDENEDYYRTVNWTRFGNVSTSKMQNAYNDEGVFDGGTWKDIPEN